MVNQNNNKTEVNREKIVMTFVRVVEQCKQWVHVNRCTNCTEIHNASVWKLLTVMQVDFISCTNNVIFLHNGSKRHTGTE